MKCKQQLLNFINILGKGINPSLFQPPTMGKIVGQTVLGSLDIQSRRENLNSSHLYKSGIVSCYWYMYIFTQPLHHKQDVTQCQF